LGVFDGAEDLPENRTGHITHPDKVLPGQKKGRPQLFLGIFPQFMQAEFMMIKEAVTSETVEAVELQVERKIRLTKEALQPAGPHLLNIDEKHVSPDEGQDCLRLFPRETEPLENPSRDLLPPLHMAVEMGPRRVFGTGHRLADIVEDDRPGEARPLKIVIPLRAGHFSTLRLLASLNGKWGQLPIFHEKIGSCP
jgi:hypothetical protein